MGRFPALVKFGSKLVLEILPSVAATVIGGYLLTQLHFTRASEPAAPPPQAASAPAASTPAPDVPTVREDRAAMREVLKERRENPEAPAVVRPIATAAATLPANSPTPVIAQVPPAMDSIAPNEPVERAAAPSSRPNVAAAPVALPRARPDSTSAVYAPAPPPGLPPAPAISLDAPLQVAPVGPVPSVAATASTAQSGSVLAVPPPPTPAQPAPRRGVFSAFSSIVGGAASATGNTVNWVIDLPGKAIEAGGRVIGIDPPPPPSKPFS